MNRKKLRAAQQARVRQASGERCGYCLSPQRLVLGRLEFEHIIPLAGGGGDDDENLCLACALCNRYKGSQTSAWDPVSKMEVILFNPRRDDWQENFSWIDDGTRIVGRTAIGRATVDALKLNNAVAVEVRRNWVSAGWKPPDFD